jgi:hypothetical protein
MDEESGGKHVHARSCGTWLLVIAGTRFTPKWTKLPLQEARIPVFR